MSAPEAAGDPAPDSGTQMAYRIIKKRFALELSQRRGSSALLERL
jgi:hypothetical protein